MSDEELLEDAETNLKITEMDDWSAVQAKATLSITASLLVIARNTAAVSFDNVMDGEPHLPPANETRKVRTS
jgi:hypothetical protein